LNLIHGARAGGTRSLAALARRLVAAISPYAIRAAETDRPPRLRHNLPAWQAFQARLYGFRMRPSSESGCPEGRGPLEPLERLLSAGSAALHTTFFFESPAQSHAACVQLSEAGRIGGPCVSGYVASEHRPTVELPIVRQEWNRPWLLRGSGQRSLWGGTIGTTPEPVIGGKNKETPTVSIFTFSRTSRWPSAGSRPSSEMRDLMFNEQGAEAYGVAAQFLL